MRAWLMNISLVDGWFPATLFSVTAVLAAILLGTAIWETVAGSRDGGKRTFAVVVCPVVIAIIAGIAGLVIAWLLSDVFVVFGVELGPHVVAWAGCGCAIIGFAICYAVQHRGVLRAVAVVLTVFAVLSAATGIDQAYGEYATIGSLFGQDTYREADLTGMAKRSDLISVTQWKQKKADGSVSNIPAHGEVRKVNIPATASHFEARKALVYLPPAALATAKHKPALPVILMMSGQPGSPGRVFAAGGIQTMMDDYAQHHGGLAPIVIAADQLAAGQRQDDGVGRGQLGKIRVVPAGGAGAVAAADEEKVPDGTLVDGLDDLLRMAQYGMVGKAGGDHTAAVHARDEGVLWVAAQLKRLGNDRRKIPVLPDVGDAGIGDDRGGEYPVLEDI